ncbi:MAG: hypothetical protein O3B87_02365 [bacterium]|nr:hypothetical protein [bacterium]
MTEVATPTASVELKKGLPPVGVLFNDAWKLFQAKWVKLVVFFLILIGIMLGIYFVFAIMGILVLGVGSLLTLGDPGAISEVFSQPSVYLPFGGIMFLFMATIIVMSIAVQAGILLLVDDEKKDQSAFSYLKRGFTYIVPLFLIGIITFFLLIGGMTVLFIPMLIMAILLMFSIYTVVLENKKAMDAIRMSVSMVAQNFWGILGRVLLLFLLILLLQLVIGQMGEAEVLGSITVLILLPLTIALNIFSLTYSYSLYKHARAAYDEKKESSMTWMWVVAILGWIFIVMSMSTILRSQEVKDAFMMGFNEEFQNETEGEYEEEYDDSFMMMKPELQFEFLLTEARAEAGAPEIEEDQRLCAYASRRLKQLEEFGGFDDYAGMYEDLNDAKLSGAYFQEGVQVYNRVWEKEGTPTEGKDILDAWTKSKDSNSLLSDKYTGICVRGDDTFITAVLTANE